MLTLKLALRTILRRKGRMALIGALVAFGTFVIVFGSIFAASAKEASRDSIIHNFTGDLVLYSSKAKEAPSPFAFNTPPPSIADVPAIESFLDSLPEVEAHAAFAQNSGVIQVERGGSKVDLPLIFYAVDPASYRRVFGNIAVEEGSYFGEGGVLISRYQNEQYARNYGAALRVGEAITLLGITEGGVNTAPSKVLGLFEPVRYKGVFDYVNFVDAASYSRLFNFTGVAALPEAFDRGLAAAERSEDAVFGLAEDKDFGKLDLASLKSETLSGFTMIAVRLKDHGALAAVSEAVGKRPELGVKVATWREASGLYARVAEGLQAFIYVATALIFLVVTLIFMNTLIINVVERTAEIGTMRAIGSDKSFVRGIFLAETLMLNVAASLVAMAAALLAVAATGTAGVPLPDSISQFLIGGGSLRLRPSAGPFVGSLAVVVAVSVLATVYPVRVAASITPLKAMSSR